MDRPQKSRLRPKRRNRAEPDRLRPAETTQTVAVFKIDLLPGPETFIRNQGESLQRWKPRFVGLVRVESPISSETDHIVALNGGRTRNRDLVRSMLTGRRAALARWLQEQDVELVHGHFLQAGMTIRGAAARRGVPLIVTVHGADVTVWPTSPFAGGPVGQCLRRWAIRETWSKAALVIAVSEFIRDRAIALGANPEKVIVHHIGVPIPTWQEPGVCEFDVCFVGRLVDKKAPLDFIDAVHTLGETRPIRAVMIGDGPLRDAVEERARRGPAEIIVLGAQSPEVVAATVLRSKVFCLPSKTAENGDSEGLPIVCLEAMSLGKPVVSTMHSGIPEAVVDGETGLLSQEGDLEALTANLRLLVEDPTLASRLGRAGRQRVVEHFDIVKQSAKLEEIYDEVVSRYER